MFSKMALYVTFLFLFEFPISFPFSSHLVFKKWIWIQHNISLMWLFNNGSAIATLIIYQT